MLLNVDFNGNVFKNVSITFFEKKDQISNVNMWNYKITSNYNYKIMLIYK